MIEPRALLAQLDLQESEIDVYTAMLGGALSARDIIKVTNRSRPTVYYALSALERRGLLSKTGLDENNLYRVEPLNRLLSIVQAKQDALQSTSDDLKQFITQYSTPTPGDSKPHVAFYEGTNAIKSIIMETVYCHGRSIDTIVPTRNFFSQLDPSFVQQYIEMRHSLGIKTRNLWAEPLDQVIIDQFYNRAEIRTMSDGLGDRFRSTVFMYDDVVLYISSLASGYALVVRSAEHRELMRALYGVIWGLSKPLK